MCPLFLYVNILVNMIVPNIQRVLIKPLLLDELKSSGLIIAGQLKAGENLYYGQVLHPGLPYKNYAGVEVQPKFQEGQYVYYSEYSSAGVFDYRSVVEGKKGFSEVQKEGWVIVAEDDILAYDDNEVSKPTKKN